ncbi:MAG: hypothetical protein IKW57_02515 [Alphaproteobacteria bacterium]|nr:hypothetical protein [Alphaproteobacteria bacterium]
MLLRFNIRNSIRICSLFLCGALVTNHGWAAKCEPGKYWVEWAQRCYWCSSVPGLYCPGDDQAYDCPDGKYPLDIGATSIDDCLCPPGTYWNDWSMGCDTCESGYYCPGDEEDYSCYDVSWSGWSYTDSDAGAASIDDCYISLTCATCNQTGCPTGYACTYQNASTEYKIYYKQIPSCPTPSGNCAIATQTCNTPCSAVQNNTSYDGTEVCTRECNIENGTCSYVGATRSFTDTCAGKYTSDTCQSAGQTCSGCSQWTRTQESECSGGTIVINCHDGYTPNADNTECVANTPKCGAGQYLDGTTCVDCPANYPLSDGGDVGADGCYKNMVHAGTQNTCKKPEHSVSYACGVCTPGFCIYRDYNEITNETCVADACDMPTINVICDNGYYTTGGTCVACTNKPANSSYTGSATSNACPWKCNDGYNQTSDNTCVQLCDSGITHIHLQIPLYSVAQTSPAINVSANGTVCYSGLVPGAGAGLNVDYNGTTYHATW